MGKKPTKRMHTVPKFNLDLFTDEDGLLWAYDTSKGALSKQTPLNTAVVKDFYTFETGDGQKLEVVEKVISFVEDGAAPVIRKLQSGNFKLSDEERWALSFYIALQHERTPKFRQNTLKSLGEASKKLFQIQNSNKKYLQEVLKSMDDGTGKSLEERADEAYKDIQAGNYDIKVPKELQMQIMVKNLPLYAGIFHDQKWYLVKAPKSASFITSDSPFVMVQTDPDMSLFGQPRVGYLVPGTEMTIPLTPKLLLTVVPSEGPDQIINANRNLVKTINKRTAAFSDRFLYAQSKPLLSSIGKDFKPEEMKKEE